MQIKMKFGAVNLSLQSKERYGQAQNKKKYGAVKIKKQGRRYMQDKKEGIRLPKQWFGCRIEEVAMKIRNIINGVQ